MFTSRGLRQTAHHAHADAVLDVLGAGVMAVRGNGLISSANPQAARILRSSVPELEGRFIQDFVAPIDELIATAAAGSRGEVTVRLGDGSSVALGYSLSTLHDVPGGDQHVLLFQEISSVLELRKQRDRLLQMAVLGDVMPTLLHEIRNPLAAVTAMLEVLVEDAGPDLQTDLHSILCEVRRMTLGLQGIGGLVRTMHSGTNCAVDLAVRESCRLLEPTARRRDVELRAVGPDLPLLPLDRGAICGVVFNLVKNAIDACPNGGHVLVDARLDGDDLTLTVTDDGVGMSDAVAAQCRELFYTTKDTGCGVGLALCHQVAEQSGGALTIDSRPGEGTRVTVRVPTRAQSKPPSAK